MQIGLIGAGNMATALARGLGEPALVSDPVSARAEALAADVGGQALASNVEVAERADVVVLCHKPVQLDPIADELRGRAKAVVSILGGVPVGELDRAYPDTPVYRFIPNIPAEVRQGVFCFARGELASQGPEAEILDLFGRAGTVIRLDDSLIDTAMALMSCGPAFLALVVEAMVDAGVRHGLQPDDAALMAVETMGGTAAVLRENGLDTAGLRKRVTSPGGSTARGVAALERGGIRAAFQDAVGAVVQMAKR